MNNCTVLLPLIVTLWLLAMSIVLVATVMVLSRPIVPLKARFTVPPPAMADCKAA